jgi:hypothetical protein
MMTNLRSDMTTIDQLLEAAKLAMEDYFHGTCEDQHNSITALAAAIKAYESQQETVRLSKPITPNPNEIF